LPLPRTCPKHSSDIELPVRFFAEGCTGPIEFEFSLVLFKLYLF
jgi:hypothetical protein